MRQSLTTGLMLALVVPLALALAVAAQARPAAQEIDPAQDANLLPARVAFVHAAPFNEPDSAVTLTATQSGQTGIIASGLTISDTLSYLSMPSGSYTFRIYSGTLTLGGLSGATPAYTETLALQGGTDYTVVAAGLGTAEYGFDLIPFIDTLPARGSNEGLLRIIHAAPLPGGPVSAAVDVVNEGGGPPLADDLGYGTGTAFLPIVAGSYNLRIDPGAGGAALIDPPAFDLDAGEILTLVAVGDGTPAGVVALPFTQRADAQVRVVHAAPFAAGAATASPFLDPTFGTGANQLFGALDYGEFSLYKTISPGLYDAKVVAGASITGTVALTQSLAIQDGQRLTLVIVGTNTTTYPLALDALSDNRTQPPASATSELRFFHAAPFAPNPAASGVDVVADDGTPLTPPVTDLGYRELTAYLTQPSGQALNLKLVQTGTTTNVLDLEPLTLNAGSAQTVIVIGGANSHPADLLLLNDLLLPRTILLPFVARAEP